MLEGATFFTLARDAFFLAAVLLGAGLGGVAVARALVRERDYAGLVCAIGLTTGVALFGWIFAQLLIYLPGQPAEFYVGFAALYAVAGFGAGWFLSDGLWRDIRGGILARWGERPLTAFISLAFWVPLSILLAALALVTLSAPLYANDSLEYAQAAREVFEARNLDLYPFLDREVSGGLVTPWTHPPGYLSFLTLGNLLQGSAAEARIIKLVAPIFVLLQVIMVIALAGRGRILAGAAAGVLLLLTPVYFAQAAESSIDAYRIAVFTAAIASFWLMARAPGLGSAILAGLATGMAHYSHSIGLLTLGFAIPLYLLTAKSPWIRNGLHILLATAISVIFVAAHALKNLANYGTLLQDGVALWRYPELRFEDHLSVERMLSTAPDAVLNGVLRGFTQIDLFGIQLLALLVALGIGAWGRLSLPSIRQFVVSAEKRGSVLAMALIVVAGFLGFLLLTAAAGSDLAIKNARYFMTVQPFVAIALAIVLTGGADRERSVAS